MPYRALFAAIIAVMLGTSGCCCLDKLGLNAPFFPSCSSGGCGSSDDCGGCPARCGLFGWGCGETYWGDYASDPPRCDEPCDQCGNWVGPVEHEAIPPYGGGSIYRPGAPMLGPGEREVPTPHRQPSRPPQELRDPITTQRPVKKKTQAQKQTPQRQSIVR